jgi:hypothetical protein
MRWCTSTLRQLTVLWSAPVRATAPTTIETELKLVHQRVLDEEQDAVGNLLWLREAAGEDGRGLQLGLEVGLFLSALGNVES